VASSPTVVESVENDRELLEEGHAVFRAVIKKILATWQWVETNQSNFRIYLTDIHLSPPHGTILMA